MQTNPSRDRERDEEFEDRARMDALRTMTEPGGWAVLDDCAPGIDAEGRDAPGGSVHESPA